MSRDARDMAPCSNEGSGSHECDPPDPPAEPEAAKPMSELEVAQLKLEMGSVALWFIASVLTWAIRDHFPEWGFFAVFVGGAPLVYVGSVILGRSLRRQYSDELPAKRSW